MTVSWHKLQVDKESVVLVELEISETDFVVARLNGLSESAKMSEKLRWFARMAEEQEANEAVPFEEHVQQLQRAMMIYGGDGLHDLNEQRTLYGLPVLDEAIQKEEDSGKSAAAESINKRRV